MVSIFNSDHKLIKYCTNYRARQ